MAGVPTARVRKRARTVVAGMLAAAALAAGCGVETDDSPRTIPRDNVPDRLLDQGPDAGEDDGGAQFETVNVWFVRNLDNGGVELTQRRRQVPRPGNATSILEALLLDPPDEEERDTGIVTAIPSTARLASSPPELQDGGVLVVDLTEGLYEVQSDTLRNAYGQIVCTAMEVPHVRGVIFESEGRPAAALDGDSRSVSGPLDCNDYADLMPTS